MKGILTCPKCSKKQEMEIPSVSCMHAYTCDACKKEIKAKVGCCVFCDYGDKPCPIANQ